MRRGVAAGRREAGERGVWGGGCGGKRRRGRRKGGRARTYEKEVMRQSGNRRQDYDLRAPDGCGLRLLYQTWRGSMGHTTRQSGKVASPVRHRTVEEIWYVLEGRGEIWRKIGLVEDISKMTAGSSLTIPTSTSFQFRNTGDSPLTVLIVTMPPWPGEQEAEASEGRWQAST